LSYEYGYFCAKQWLKLNFSKLKNELMSKVKLNILGLSFSQTQENAYVLILIEDGGDRRIPIIIGAAEAQAIAIQLENLKAPRPLTHDLFHDFANNFEIQLDEVVVYKLEEGVFYSKIIARKGDEIKEIDARTSDAVALAVRFECPIFTTSEVVEKAGIVLDIEKQTQEQDVANTDSPVSKEPKPASTAEYGSATVEELNQMLEEAIGHEDYEKASEIRDEIQRRQQNS